MNKSKILTEELDRYEEENGNFDRNKIEGHVQVMTVLFRCMDRVKDIYNE